MLQPNHRFSLPLLLLAVALFGTTACNTSARILIEKNKLDGVAVTNATLKTANSQLASCTVQGADPTRLILSTVIFGSVKDPKSNQTRIVALAPGDTVDNGRLEAGDTVTSQSFNFNKVCFKPSGQGICNANDISTQGATISTQSINFRERMKKNDRLGLIILMDQSGSISGAVQAKDSKLIEVAQVSPDRNNGSDPNGVRVTALQDFIANLAQNDKVLIVGYNSHKGLFTVCNITEKDVPDFNERAKKCYTANKSIYTDSERAKNTLRGSQILYESKGRTNLWEAVQFALEFHKTNSSGLKPQILVVSDGPDTCGKYEGQTPCSQVDFAALRPSVTANVPIHFAQFASKTAAARDPEQEQIACLSGGEFIFVENVDGLRDRAQGNPSRGALTMLRFMLRGTWQVHVNFPSISGEGAGTYRVQSELSFSAPDLGTQQTFSLQLNPARWDTRLNVTK